MAVPPSSASRRMREPCSTKNPSTSVPLSASMRTVGRVSTPLPMTLKRNVSETPVFEPPASVAVTVT